MSKQNRTRYMIVMRHGLQHSDSGLTDKGREQVKITAQTLEAEGLIPDFLITSFPSRAKQSAAILSDHFHVAVSRTTDLMDVLNSSFIIDDFLQSLPQEPRIIALSGHDESLHSFGHYLLDEQDAIKLFHLLPESRIRHGLNEDAKALHLTGGHADALILQSDAATNTSADWHLYGWLADGQIKRAKDITASDPILSHGKKYERVRMSLEIPGQPEP